MTFAAERLILIFEYAIWAGLALFVGSWWGITVLRNLLKNRRMQPVDWLMAGISVMALATFVSRILWLPGHYYHGIGQPVAAIKWSADVAPILTWTNIFIIIGLTLHVKTAWIDGSRALILALLGAWLVLMVLGWWMVGGFGFEYI